MHPMHKGFDEGIHTFESKIAICPYRSSFWDIGGKMLQKEHSLYILSMHTEFPLRERSLVTYCRHYLNHGSQWNHYKVFLFHRREGSSEKGTKDLKLGEELPQNKAVASSLIQLLSSAWDRLAISVIFQQCPGTWWTEVCGTSRPYSILYRNLCLSFPQIAAASWCI